MGDDGRLLSRRLAGLPLRLKLVVAASCLTSVALAVISVAGVSMFGTALVGRADNQLQADAQRLVGRSLAAEPDSRAGPVPGMGGTGEVSVEVLGAGGEPVIPVGPGAGAGPAIPTGAGWVSAHAGRTVTVPARYGGESWRVVVEPIRYQARHLMFVYDSGDFSVAISGRSGHGLPGTLVVGTGLDGIGRMKGRLALTGLAVGGVVLVLVAVLVAAVTRAGLRPLAEIEDSARAVAAGELSRRVPARGAARELGGLTRSLNLMLGRTGEAFRAHAAAEAATRRYERRMRQAVADVGHGLREPLSVIDGFAEYYWQRGLLGAGEFDRMMRRVEDEAARMSAVISALEQPSAPGDGGTAGSVHG